MGRTGFWLPSFRERGTLAATQVRASASHRNRLRCCLYEQVGLPELVTRGQRVPFVVLLDQFLALFVTGSWNNDFGHDEQVPGFNLAVRGYALASEPQLLAAGSSRGDRHGFQSAERGNFDPCAKNGLCNRDRNLDLEVLVFTREVGMGLDLNFDDQVTGRLAALTGFAASTESELGPGFDSCRNLDVEGFGLAAAPCKFDGGFATLDGGQERDGE